MSRTKVVPFERAHLDLMFQGAPGWISLTQMSDFLSMLLRHPAYTLETPEGIAGSAGVVKMWHGVGEAWALVRPTVVRKYPKAFHKAVKQGLYMIADGLELHRVQANVIADFHRGRAWAESLGFEMEGIMKQAAPNKQDMIRYVLLREQGKWQPQY